MNCTDCDDVYEEGEEFFYDDDGTFGVRAPVHLDRGPLESGF